MRRLGQRLREAKGVRAFAFEVLVVVVGVLIALGAQELVDDWNSARKVDALETRFAELYKDEASNLKEMLTVAPCVHAQVAAARKSLLDQRPQGPFMALATDRSGSFVIRTPRRSFDTSVWQAANAEGVVAHLPADRRAQLTDYYTGIGGYIDAQSRFGDLVNRMRVLAEPVRMPDAARVALLQDLSAIDAHLDDLVVNARQGLAHLDALGHSKGEDFISGTKTFCRANRLPLGDWKSELATGRREVGLN